MPPGEAHVEYVFGEGRWEKEAECEADGACIIVQRAQGQVAGTQIPPGLPAAGG